jgi:5-methylcytosine-specific restriction endonuclease McrA
MNRVLVLNNNYAALGICDWRKAVILYFTNKIEILESYSNELHSPNMTMKQPAVVRVLKYIRPKSKKARFNKDTIYARDRGRCSYCGEEVSRSKATYDHILPKSRGGKTTFGNIALSCGACNSFKNNRTPEEAKMELLTSPFVPYTTVGNLTMVYGTKKIPEWEKWLNYEA